MKALSFITLFIATILYSCNNNNGTVKDKEKTVFKDTTPNSLVPLTKANTHAELLCQNWENAEDLKDDVLNGSSSDGLEIPFHSYCFFDDGSVTVNPRDEMKLGSWKLDDKTKIISVVLEDGSKKEYKIMGLGTKNLLLKAGAEKTTEYNSDAKKHSVLTDDPFYSANNKWRIKPTHSEGENDIKKRVIQAVIFYSKFFKDNADRGLASISFYGLPTCFKWYGGGISIINKEKIGQKWIGCFYNKDQAIQGQQLLENVISKKYKWDKAQPKWVRQSADVLLQMADSLK